MTKTRDMFLTIAAAVVILQALAFGEAGRAIAQTISNVVVKNTTTNPVPVKAVGTTVVKVNNTATAPVWVRDVDAARQPVNIPFNHSLSEGQDSTAKLIFQVPAGKRLVVEQFSFQTVLPTGQRLYHLSIGTQVRTTEARFKFNCDFMATVGSYNYYNVSEMVHLYADPGTDITLYFARADPSGTVTASGALAGYYVNVP